MISGKEIELPDPAKLIGAQLKAHLVVNEYNGDPQNDVAYFIEPTEAKEPLDIPV